jgi:SAM-dependent methyltransferase
VTEGDNYATPDNLLARISIHSYAKRPDWVGWLFDRETPRERRRARVLDVGCGPGGLWVDNQERISPEWAITLADSSAAMIELARSRLGDRAEYLVADVQSLPFDDDSFDVVIANHMLYHVQDRPRAFAEVGRVLSCGGAFHCSTNGHGHLEQLSALRPPSPLNLERHVNAFGLETGPRQLEPFFQDINVQRFDNLLAVPSADPILAYIQSSENHREDDDLAAVRHAVQAEIRRSGVFSITTRPGVISCLNP